MFGRLRAVYAALLVALSPGLSTGGVITLRTSR